MSHERPHAELPDRESPARRIGILTTDETLSVTGWDEALAAMTGIAGADAIGRPLAAVVPDLEARGLLAIVKEALATGAPIVLAPAFHKYFIPAAPARPSAHFDRMQQRVAVAALIDEGRPVGLVITVEDVTERLDLEQQLAGELRHADRASRLQAIERLAALSPVDGLGPLPSAMGDDDWQVRRLAVEALAGRRDPGLAEALVSALRGGHRNFNVLSSALQLLSISGIDLTTALVDLLEHPDVDLRIQVVLALGTQTGPEAVTALLAALDDDDMNVRFHAIEAIGKLRPPAAVERLAALAESRDFFLAFPALEALSRISDPAVAPRLVPLLQDDLVGDQAAEALGEIGEEDAVAPLAAALDRPDSSAASIVGALAGIRGRYADLFSGGGDHIEELVRGSISAGGAQRLIDAAGRASGSSLRQFVTVLGWLRGAAVERALAQMLGTPGVQTELLEAIVRFGSPMVDGVVEQLESDDPEIRSAAAVALGRIGDGRAVVPLVRILDDDGEQPDLLVAVAGALARLGDRRAFAPLLALIGAADLGVRQAAIGALNSIGHPEMGERVRALLDAADPRVRESAVRIAGYFGYPACADALLARCRDADETVRAAALESVAALDDDRAAPLLIAALAADTPRPRAAAARGLAHADGDAAVKALRRGVEDADPWVRYFSVISLGRQADRPSLPLLARIAEGDPAHQVRLAAVGAIGDIGTGSDASAIGLLAAFAEDADDELAIAAVRALGSVEAASATEALRGALGSPRAGRRAAAAEAIARRGGAAALELLQWTAAADADASVARAAIAGLGRIAAGATAQAGAAAAALAGVAADPARQADAVAALARLPESAIPRLGEALSSRDPAVRRAVIDALGRLAHPTASSYILTGLTDADASVRQLAIVVLARLGTRGVARSFKELAAGDPSPRVRRAAEMALQRLGKGQADASRPEER